MPGGTLKAVRQLRQQVDESIAHARRSKPASQVFRELCAHHATRAAERGQKPRATNAKSKTRALLALAKKRKATRLKAYDCIGDFHGGRYECNHVSPWTKSGHNVDADVMVIGQDWVGSDVLERDLPDDHVLKYGFDPKFPTNSNLNKLLKHHFGLSREDCYLTNLFAFIKPGHASANIPLVYLTESARKFTLEEIRIVSPRLVICLGLRTFRALARAAGEDEPRNMKEAIGSSFSYGRSAIHCVAHTGAFGMNNRGPDQVRKDWRKLAATYA